MASYLRYIAYLLFLNVVLLSDDRILFDLDAIENNQILLNKYNTSILDSLSYHSIIFNQNHHLPYGTFIFSELHELSRIDTAADVSQFIYKKGDFKYRDLLISLRRQSESNVRYEVAGHNRSYTPLNIQGLDGSGFIQNFIFDIYKESGADYIGSTIAYHRENPDLPISYNFTSDDVGVYHTRESRSILWGFHLKRQLSEKLKIEFKNSNQFSFLKNRYNVSGDGFDESGDSFNGQYFTIWNIFKSNYAVNKSISIKFDFSLLKQRQLYQTPGMEEIVDSTGYYDVWGTASLGSNIETFNGVLGIKMNNYFFGVNVKGLKINFPYHATTDEFGVDGSPFYPIQDFEKTLKPYVVMNFIKKKNFNFSYAYSYDDTFIEMPYGGAFHPYNLEIPILYLSRHSISLSSFNNYFQFESSVGHIVPKLHVTVYGNEEMKYSPYYYSDVGLQYNRSSLSVSIGLTAYLEEDAADDARNTTPRVDGYASYGIKYNFPIRNRPFSLSLKSSGRWSHLRDGAFNLNTLPMVQTYNIDGSGVVHYMDLSAALEFDKFTISYHNITNGGHDFTLESPLSDTGGSYSLPQYSLLGADLSILHYLNISWTFVD